MTPEKRAEARAAIEELRHTECSVYEFSEALGEALDALEAAERERDTARALVETLTTALRISRKYHGASCVCGVVAPCTYCVTRAALKATGVEA